MARAWGQCEAISHGLEMRLIGKEGSARWGVGISLKSLFFLAQMGCYSFFGKQEYELPIFFQQNGDLFF